MFNSTKHANPSSVDFSRQNPQSQRLIQRAKALNPLRCVYLSNGNIQKASKPIIHYIFQEKPAVVEASSESESAEGKKSGTFQQEGESGPTDLSVAGEASQV
jgi:hypothetical protein